MPRSIPNLPQLNLRNSRHASGFSLIEVMMALGVFAFSAVVILGLLPTGLTSFQQSTHATVASRLASEIQSELQQVGLSSFPTNTTYFDADGRFVTNGSGNTVYEVYRTVQVCGLPGTNSSPLNRICVQVVKNPERNSLSYDSNGLLVLPKGLEERTFQFHAVAP